MQLDPHSEAGKAWIVDQFGDLNHYDLPACCHCKGLFTAWSDLHRGECEDCAALPCDGPGKPESSHWSYMGSCA
jgi:hypothetical protein